MYSSIVKLYLNELNVSSTWKSVVRTVRIRVAHVKCHLIIIIIVIIITIIKKSS